MNTVGRKSSHLYKLLTVEARSRKWNSTMKLPFKIPEPIERSPTALLEALADTVGTDPTAPPPGIIDDPATISSYFKRKDYYLTREYGRRAARKLIEEWPTLFMFDRDYPRLPAFRPQKPLDPAVVETNVKNLRKMLAGKHIEDAITLFKRMEEQSVEVPKELEHQLFVLACYYNGQDVPMQEKEWPGMRSFYESEPQKRQEDGIVDEFFFLDRLDKTEHVYSAMICNFCKYDSGSKDNENISLKKAKELFKEMLEKELTPTLEVFNYFLHHKLSVDDEDFDYSATLKLMAKLGIKPDVETFTNVLGCIPMTLPIEERMRLAQSLYAEMANCGIEPDLTFYSKLLKIPYDPDFSADLPSSKERDISINLLNEILTKFEGRESSIKYSRKTDEIFFLTAIFVAKKGKNIHMAQRLEKLHSHKNNKVKMTPLVTEDRFYSEYLHMMENFLHLDDFFKFYTKYVPSKTSLSAKMAARIITRHLIKTTHWPLTQRIIEDGIAVGHAPKLEIAKVWQTLLANFPRKELNESQEQEFKNLIRRLVSIWKEFNAEEPMEGQPKRFPIIPIDSFINHFDFMKLNVVDVK